MGIERPRCAAIRVILYELSRIGDHILCVGLQAMDLGAFSVMLWSFVDETVDIFENVTGARLTSSFTRVGGLFRDVPADFESTTRAFHEVANGATLREMEGMLNTNRIFMNTVKGIGRISKEDAMAYGLTGPLLRVWRCRSTSGATGRTSATMQGSST